MPRISVCNKSVKRRYSSHLFSNEKNSFTNVIIQVKDQLAKRLCTLYRRFRICHVENTAQILRHQTDINRTINVWNSLPPTVNFTASVGVKRSLGLTDFSAHLTCCNRVYCSCFNSFYVVYTNDWAAVCARCIRCLFFHCFCGANKVTDRLRTERSNLRFWNRLRRLLRSELLHGIVVLLLIFGHQHL